MFISFFHRLDWTLAASGLAHMKLHPIHGYIQVEVHAWWEWFITTILDDSPAEIFAVENRSHNHLTRLPVME